MFLFLFSEDVLSSFSKNTDILDKAHSSRHLTHKNVFKKLDAVGIEATSLWHSCMICERQNLSRQ